MDSNFKLTKMKNKYILLSALAIGFASCEPEFENAVDANYSAGEANFSSYVAIGNSLTAGYMDATVYKSGQMNSFPNLLAQQFALVGGGEFTQPSYADDVNDLGGFSGVPGTTRYIINAGFKTYPSGTIYLDSLGKPVSKGLQRITGTSTISLTSQQKAFNNMGVPGAKSFHLNLPGYASLNPYYGRMATSSSATVIGDAMTKNPTFFTNWIGANDVLAFASSGGVGVDQFAAGNNNPMTYGFNDITSAGVFQQSYSTLLNILTSNGAKGVVATIPNITSIPFFTTVPYNPLTAYSLGRSVTDATIENAPKSQVVGTGQAVISQLNTQLYGPLKQALTAFGAGNRINLLNPNGKNPLLIKDESLTNLSAQLTAAFTPTLGASTAAFYGQVFGQARQATAQDLILLTTSAVIGTAPSGVPSPLDKYGITYPLEDQHLLVPSEITAINNATTSFNASINAIVNNVNTNAGKKLVVVADMNSIMNQLVSGLRVENGSFYTANYFSSSANEGAVLFSLDGVHPNARGYAVIANEIIKVINREFKANLPLKNASYYPGINIVPVN